MEIATASLWVIAVALCVVNFFLRRGSQGGSECYCYVPRAPAWQYGSRPSGRRLWFPWHMEGSLLAWICLPMSSQWPPFCYGLPPVRGWAKARTRIVDLAIDFEGSWHMPLPDIQLEPRLLQFSLLQALDCLLSHTKRQQKILAVFFYNQF